MVLKSYGYCIPGRAIMCLSVKLWQIAKTDYGREAFVLILLWTLTPLLAFGMVWFKLSELRGWTVTAITAAFLIELASLDNETFGQGFARYALPFLVLAVFTSLIGLAARPGRGK